MVLESLLSGREVIRHPITMLFTSIVVSSCGLWIAYFTFPEDSSILGIAFLTVALVPIMHSIFVREEYEEARHPGWAPGFIARHFNVLEIYAWFFIGLIISNGFWYAVLDTDTRGQMFFRQELVYCNITGNNSELCEEYTANQALYPTAKAVGVGYNECKNPETRNLNSCFYLIFENNAFLMLLAFLFSFIYGAGAIFLIGWNASVIGVVIGKEVLAASTAYADAGLFGIPFAFLQGGLRGLGLLPHGIPESFGYFIGAIAGGIISVAVSKKKLRSGEFSAIGKDAIVMLLIALGFLLLGASIEAAVILSG